jgi:hypothetical protein
MRHVLVFVAATIFAISAAAAGTDEHKSDYRQPPGFKQGKKTGWEGRNTPPGWDRGEKKGWNGNDQPPGLQAEKDHGDKNHDYKDDDHKNGDHENGDHTKY